MASPWEPENFTNYGIIRIENAPAVQLDFSTSVSSDFPDTQCDYFGQAGVRIGIRFCVIEDETVPSALRVGKS